MANGDSWGCSYLVVRGEILGFAKDEPVRKHSSGMSSSIKNVRLGDEFKAGHAAKAINIPLQLISQSADKLKGKTVVTVCKSGARSAMAVSILEKAGVKAFNGGTWSNFAGSN